ncbi:MAG: hypothetical protein KBT06_02300 [Prevotellaceae bacterium]|nr:hypothetical protein [Candidatus Colivivens equi]
MGEHIQEFKEKDRLWKSSIDYKSIAAVFNILPDVFEKKIESGDFDANLVTCVEGGDYIVPLYILRNKGMG